MRLHFQFKISYWLAFKKPSMRERFPSGGGKLEMGWVCWAQPFSVPNPQAIMRTALPVYEIVVSPGSGPLLSCQTILGGRRALKFGVLQGSARIHDLQSFYCTRSDYLLNEKS